MSRPRTYCFHNIRSFARGGASRPRPAWRMATHGSFGSWPYHGRRSHAVVGSRRQLAGSPRGTSARLAARVAEALASPAGHNRVGHSAQRLRIPAPVAIHVSRTPIAQVKPRPPPARSATSLPLGPALAGGRAARASGAGGPRHCCSPLFRPGSVEHTGGEGDEVAGCKGAAEARVAGRCAQVGGRSRARRGARSG